MIPYTPGQLALLERDTRGSLQDEAKHWPLQEERGGRKEQFTEGETFACGFDPHAAKSIMGQVSGRGQTQEDAIVTDARLRLRLEDAETVRSGDRIEILKKAGRPLDPTQFFYVVGLPEIGSVRAVLNLERVEL